MNWIFTTGISVYATLAVVPVVVSKMSLWWRLAGYLAVLAIGAGIWYAAWQFLPSLGVLVYALMAAVPLLLTGIFLLRQPGRRRTIGATVLLVVVALVVYGTTAARLSHASDLTDGVIYLPSYLSGQAWVRDALNDPESAHFKDLSFNEYHGDWQMCGQVNARNRMGGLVGYTRFYVSRSDVLHSVTFNAGGEGFDEFMRHCYGDDWDKPSARPPL